MTVSIAFNPAAFIVSPDSIHCQIVHIARGGDTYKIDYTVSHAKGTCRLDAPAHILDSRVCFRFRLSFQLAEILFGQAGKTGHDSFPEQVGDIVDCSIFRDLDFKTTLSESKFEDFVDFAVTFFGREVEFGNLILSCDSEVHISLGNKSRNICSG